MNSTQNSRSGMTWPQAGVTLKRAIKGIYKGSLVNKTSTPPLVRLINTRTECVRAPFLTAMFAQEVMEAAHSALRSVFVHLRIQKMHIGEITPFWVHRPCGRNFHVGGLTLYLKHRDDIWEPCTHVHYYACDESVQEMWCALSLSESWMNIWV